MAVSSDTDTKLATCYNPVTAKSIRTINQTAEIFIKNLQFGCIGDVPIMTYDIKKG